MQHFAKTMINGAIIYVISFMALFGEQDLGDNRRYASWSV
jgi:hypothetical protein